MDFIRITFVDILDIVLVAMLMYYLYKVLRGTHAMSILSGILLLFVVYIVVRALNMELLTSLIGSLTSVGLIALVIIFQPEIRRFLQVCGNQFRDRQRRTNREGGLPVSSRRLGRPNHFRNGSGS